MIARAPETTKLAHLRHLLGLDRNPLRRALDRAEMGIMAAVAAAALIGVPLSAAMAAAAEHAAGVKVMRAQQTWHRVPAVLLQTAAVDGSFIYESSAVEWVRARWTAPDGLPRSGEVPARAGERADTTVRIWVDGRGQAMGIPRTPAQTRGQEIAAAMFVSVTVAVILTGIAVLAHWLLERRKLAAWEAAWTSVEPQWSRRR